MEDELAGDGGPLAFVRVIDAVDPIEGPSRFDRFGLGERILKESGFDGVIIPDHTPQVHCAAPWHAGMAHALGYLAAGLQALEVKK